MLSASGGDKYISKTVRLVFPAHDTLTGPPLHFQIFKYYHQYYLKQYGSYCLHKISASGEITTNQES